MKITINLDFTRDESTAFRKTKKAAKKILDQVVHTDLSALAKMGYGLAVKAAGSKTTRQIAKGIGKNIIPLLQKGLKKIGTLR